MSFPYIMLTVAGLAQFLKISRREKNFQKLTLVLCCTMVLSGARGRRAAQAPVRLPLSKMPSEARYLGQRSCICGSDQLLHRAYCTYCILFEQNLKVIQGLLIFLFTYCFRFLKKLRENYSQYLNTMPFKWFSKKIAFHHTSF